MRYSLAYPLIKLYFRLLGRNQRRTRIYFVGKRLKMLQNAWLHFNTHPWEEDKYTEVKGK